jgi:hypothetical protein
MAVKQPNRWSTKEAADWAEVPHRTLLDLLNEGVLPAIAIGRTRTEVLKDGTKRRRRVAKWIVPREAFIHAWQTFSGPNKRRTRRVA